MSKIWEDLPEELKEIRVTDIWGIEDLASIIIDAVIHFSDEHDGVPPSEWYWIIRMTDKGIEIDLQCPEEWKAHKNEIAIKILSELGR